MKVNIEKMGPCRKKLRIEVPNEQVNEEYDRIVQAFTSQARIPGFRQGKAPKSLVEKRFKKDIEQELKDRLVPRGYHEALQQEKINAVAVLGVEDVMLEPSNALTFSVTLDVPPDFKLPSYTKIKIKGEKTEVSDKDVKEQKDRILDQYARYEDVTGRPVQKGDLVQIDYEGVIDGKPIEDLGPKASGLGSGKDFWMLADENAFLPGFAEGLIGADVGDKKQVMVDFEADFAEKSVAGKKGTYFVDVKALREKKAAEVTEDILKQFQVDSEKALEERIRTDMQKMREDGEKQRRKNEIVKTLLEKTKLDVPESVVMQETRDAVYDIVRQQSYGGTTKEDIEGKKDEIFAAANQSATEKVKARYILHRIAEEEKIEVSTEEVSERIRSLAAHYGVTPQEFKAELQKRNSLETVEEEVRIGKTLDFLLEKAEIKE